MKKVFFTLALCSVALAASAQVELKSIDGRIDYLWDTGIGAGVTLGITDQFEVAPSASIFFGDGDLFTIGADLHYLLPEFVEKLELFPLGGVGFYHTSYEEPYVDKNYDLKFRDASDNTVFINAGFGARYHFHENWAAFAEEKYQIVDGWNHNYLTVGISYTF